MSEEFASRRLPPQNIEAEMSVLGGILLENEALNRAVEILRPDDFYRGSHGKIFSALLELSDRGEPADLVTLTGVLQNRGELEAIGGSSYLATLVDYVPTAANILYYSRIVKEKALNRQIIHVATEIAGRGYDGGEADALLDWAEKSIFELTSMKTQQAYFSAREVVKSTIAILETLYTRKEMVTGIPTGFAHLDEMTAGLQPGDLIIVAGRPSMGKTAFVLNLVEHSAIHAPKPVTALVFSLEMSKEQLVQRLLGSISHVDASRMRRGQFGDSDWPKLFEAADRLAKSQIFIDDTPSISILELRAKARRLKAEKNLDLIVVDYLQLMSGSNPESRQQEISEISRSLKGLAKELHVPVIALSQLNRSLENRTDKRPIMADLRESGAIEQDADVIMFIYRDAVYCEECRNREKVCEKGHEKDAEIIIGKQRNGPIGTIKLIFRGEYTRFENRSERDEFSS
jgi:replicative DNA helicase